MSPHQPVSHRQNDQQSQRQPVPKREIEEDIVSVLDIARPRVVRCHGDLRDADLVHPYPDQGARNTASQS